MIDAIFSGEFSKIIVLSGVFSVAVSVLVGLVVVGFQRKSHSYYNDSLQRAELSALRASYERELDRINYRLMATEDRWKEVNHLVISSQGAQEGIIKSDVVNYSRFLKNSGITEDDLAVDDKLVFVLTPFGKNHDDEYQAIKNACSDLGLIARRGDEERAAGDIFSHILKNIVKARLVVANISGRNPNVLYELGIAHALGKITLVVSRHDTLLPFDLQSRLMVIFKDEDNLRSALTLHMGKIFADVSKIK